MGVDYNKIIGYYISKDERLYRLHLNIFYLHDADKFFFINKFVSQRRKVHAYIFAQL